MLHGYPVISTPITAVQLGRGMCNYLVRSGHTTTVYTAVYTLLHTQLSNSFCCCKNAHQSQCMHAVLSTKHAESSVTAAPFLFQALLLLLRSA